MQYRSSGMSDLPPVVKNLLIINVIVWITQIFLLKQNNYFLEQYGALYPVDSGFFKIWQVISYMFMHASVNQNGGIEFFHIFFNMFTLWMFGKILENFWGSKRFLQFYILCGIGGAIAHLLTSDNAAVGASGAIMGLMAGFAYLFPNTELFLMFIPVPLKAKYIIPGLMALDLFGGISRTEDGIAHWAHLGGAATGLLLVFIWNKSKGNRRNFY
ncbi:MAG: rhomboid family intramembrane serine protease [Chitinophagaceae bacterium]|nr:rhomboid family intramembrane serine protease [Chitinophagaceae bacterium]